MSYFIKQSTASKPLLFLMVDSSDHIASKTGLTPTVTISKVGASFVSPAGAITEVGNGWYQIAANATDSNTLGPIILHATASGADPTDVIYRVVAFDPDSSTNLGLTNLDVASSTLATASVQTAVKAKTDLIATNAADSPNAVTAQGTISTNLNATVGSRSTYAGGAVASVTAPVTITMTQAVPTTNTAHTVGDALNGARAQAFGKWVITGTTLTLYASDGTTAVRTFTLNSSTTPTSRS